MKSRNARLFDDSDYEKYALKEIFDVLSYGADFDVDGLVKRLTNEDILVPSFQRTYVWNQVEASRFIESLLLGLPVPGIFLAKEQKTNKLLVIDGQQRLKTLSFFYKGYFNPKPHQKSKRVFKLKNVVKRFEELTYSELKQSDRRKLDNSLIHATIINQEVTHGYDPSTYQVFERLNTGGRKLTAQEIRVTVYHGPYIDLLKELNNFEYWRNIFGKVNDRLKDQEFILRFLAMYFNWSNYEKPMKEFLNSFVNNNRFASKRLLNTHQKIFQDTIQIICESLGDSSFRMKKGIIAAIFDAVMVGVANRLGKNKTVDIKMVKTQYNKLLQHKGFLDAINQHTSDEDKVFTRIEVAIDYFKKV